MIIHPFWLICLSVRIALIFLVRYLYKIKQKKIAVLILVLIGIGFIYQAFNGSNNEIQLNKVFWHDTRITHGMLYLISVYYLFENNLDMNSIILGLDIIFSVIYRFYLQK
jgi:putative Mn2+ efflux pump MntP